MPLHSEIPSLLLAEQAIAHAITQCADVQLNIKVYLDGSKRVTRRVIHPALEAVGVFFLPDTRHALGPSRAPTTPHFIPLENFHEDPEHHFVLDYLSIEEGVTKAYAGAPSGKLALFHSHPTSDGMPSDEDLKAAADFERGMAGHPFWGVTQLHFVHCLPSDIWWAHSSNHIETFSPERFNNGI